MHVSHSAAENAGNLKVVVVGWKDAQGQLVSVVDSSNNSYTLAVGPTTRGLAVSQFFFYAANIAEAPANANMVTVTFSAPVNSRDIRILEYSGIERSRPVDVIKAGAGNSMTITVAWWQRRYKQFASGSHDDANVSIRHWQWVYGPSGDGSPWQSRPRSRGNATGSYRASAPTGESRLVGYAVGSVRAARSLSR